MAEQHEYTRRYLAYCKEHGATPAEMLIRDEREWPGGRACGFILWLSARWQEWHKMHGRVGGAATSYLKSDVDHQAFDAWLGEERCRVCRL